MQSLMYFMPGLQKAHLAPGGKFSRSILAERGLTDVLADIRDPVQEASVYDYHGAGPGGQSGVFLVPFGAKNNEVPTVINYHAASQTWEQITDGLWIGRPKDYPIGPMDLMRKNVIRGHMVTLGDGNQWEIPVVRRVNNLTNLPSRYFKLDGQWREVVEAKYHGIFQAAGELFRQFLEGLATDIAPCLDYLVSVLSLNYRVGEVEVGTLGLLNTSNFDAALMASFDWPMDGEQKKNRNLSGKPG